VVTGGTEDIPDDPLLMEEGAGKIGTGAASQYFGFVRLERKMPKFEAIVKDPTGVKVPDAPDAQMLSIFGLAHRVDDKTIGAVITYIERFPKEFAVTFAKSACGRNSDLVLNPAMRKWSANNASLMAALTV
jgi:hypothetical protein